jgi:glutamate-ammonia-ligase adenylyltransferase
LPVRLAIIGMGRLGGLEQGYGSDADVMFVFEPIDGADETGTSAIAHDVAQELRRLLSKPAPDPALIVDADLRPEGRQGPLVRTFESYAEYYRRWSSTWESQALLRAYPIAGDQDLGLRFMGMIDSLRYPVGGVDETERREIIRLKARMESERLPRNLDRAMHMKLGRGGLSDVEWTVQLLQLEHAAMIPSLRTTSTLAALDAAAAAHLIGENDARSLRQAWLIASRARNAIVLAQGKSSDMLPSDARTRAAVARAMGYSSETAPELFEDYQRATRRARQVHERVFAP